MCCKVNIFIDFFSFFYSYILFNLTFLLIFFQTCNPLL